MKASALHALTAFATVTLMPLAASAQPSSQPTQGPMTVERMHNGFLVAPDVKVTNVDRKTSELVGGYAGWLSDDTFFVGGGGYWLASGSRDREMGYGGLIVQWFSHSGNRVGFSAKGLVGGGQATLGNTVTTTERVPSIDPRQLPQVGPVRLDLNQLSRTITTTSTVRFRESFFIAEPEVGVFLRLSRHTRLTGGVSYRLVGAEGRDENRLRGAAGSIALQIGGGS